MHNNIFVHTIFVQESTRNCPKLCESKLLIKLQCSCITFYNCIELYNAKSYFLHFSQAVRHDCLTNALPSYGTFYRIAGITDVSASKSENIIEGRDERIMEIMNYIQNNYADVTMDVLAEKFGLSKPYLSKYIKEKSGMTFQDAVKAARMKKARRLLKESNQTVESIAASVGYENVEHFNRLFKKAYEMTPVQFRRQYK